MQYLCLAGAIVLEVVATTSLGRTQGFRAPLPTFATLVGYAGAFYLLSLALGRIPVGIAYAIWSGVGIVLVTVAGWVLLKQALDGPALAGIALILAGVLVITLFSGNMAA